MGDPTPPLSQLPAWMRAASAIVEQGIPWARKVSSSTDAVTAASLALVARSSDSPPLDAEPAVSWDDEGNGEEGSPEEEEDDRLLGESGEDELNADPSERGETRIPSIWHFTGMGDDAAGVYHACACARAYVCLH
jgi:hypothetical protein